MLPDSVDCVLIDTGNIINMKDFKTKATLSPTEEVIESVKSVFQTWSENYTGDEQQNQKVFCKSENSTKVNVSDRNELKISVKIFLETFNPEDVKKATFQIMDDLGIKLVDSLIIALPPQSNKKLDLNQMRPLWRELETFVQEGKVSTIGVSDLDTADLAELYESAQVKPGINQVNLESCCVMPPEMIAYAKENDIQLLTHNDPKAIFPQDSFQAILESSVSNPSEWSVSWIVRYSVVVRCRGIIQNKGYLVCTQKKR